MRTTDSQEEEPFSLANSTHRCKFMGRQEIDNDEYDFDCECPFEAEKS